MHKLLIIFHFLLASVSLNAQETCDIKKIPFEVGEKLRYEIYYNWGKLWVNSGYAEFRIERDTLRGKRYYHLIGEGSTYKRYDWIFKVRDRFDSYVDTTSLQPHRFIRNVREGKTRIYYDYVFNYKHNRAYVISPGDENPKVDTVNLKPCAFDVLSAIYYVRTMDFESLQVNDTIPLTFILDKEIHHSYVRYGGKETLTLKDGSEYETLKFSPYLIEGTIFEGGEEMTVWVTDDKNRTPVYIESKILVGSIKVYLSEQSNVNDSD